MTDEQKKKILIVDDDDLLRNIYSAKFKEEGFDITEAKNGQEAWGIISGGNVPNLIFTGINMPDMSGFELIARIKSVPNLANIPFAISSHRGLVGDRQKAKELGIEDFIIQGETSPNEVVHRIKMILGLKDRLNIAFLPEADDGKALVNMLNKHQQTNCGTVGKQQMTLELKPTEKNGEFEIKLVC